MVLDTLQVQIPRLQSPISSHSRLCRAVNAVEVGCLGRSRGWDGDNQMSALAGAARALAGGGPAGQGGRRGERRLIATDVGPVGMEVNPSTLQEGIDESAVRRIRKPRVQP